MEINQDVVEILKEFKINKDAGLLALLGIYHKLDIETVVPEEIIKAINVTKIVDRDSRGTIIWNVPLFIGQNTDWDWIKLEWNTLWTRNMSRKASNPDVMKRMQEFFKKYPQYRKDDVIKATQMYHVSVPDPGYLKNSAAFIFDGAGAMKKSILLSWCEKVVLPSSNNEMRNVVD